MIGTIVAMIPLKPIRLRELSGETRQSLVRGGVVTVIVVGTALVFGFVRDIAFSMLALAGFGLVGTILIFGSALKHIAAQFGGDR